MVMTAGYSGQNLHFLREKQLPITQIFLLRSSQPGPQLLAGNLWGCTLALPMGDDFVIRVATKFPILSPVTGIQGCGICSVT